MTSSDTKTSFFDKFEKKRPIFQGMEAHYKSRVLPILEKMEKERQSTFDTALICQGILALVGFTLMVLISYSGNVIGAFFVIIPTIGLMIFTWGHLQRASLIMPKRLL